MWTKCVHYLVILSSILWTSNGFKFFRSKSTDSSSYPLEWNEDYETSFLPDSPEGLRTIIDDEDIKEDSHVRFLLYTRNHPDTYTLFQPSTMYLLRSSDFDASKPTKILIHGWRNSHKSKFPIVLTNAYLTVGDMNIILVEWEKLAYKNYPTSKYYLTSIADEVAKLIEDLNNQYHISPSQLHVIGHSLGAHIAGIVGQKLMIGKLNRITGLDPAAPLFSKNDKNRLSENSAEFVDVIHSCSRLLGFMAPIGTADFYPNKGTFVQPGCGLDIKGSCSHRRAYYYFAESIRNPDAFWAVSCPNWDQFKSGECNGNDVVHMGEHVSRNAHGVYYLVTNKDEPFGKRELSLRAN